MLYWSLICLESLNYLDDNVLVEFHPLGTGHLSYPGGKYFILGMSDVNRTAHEVTSPLRAEILESSSGEFRLKLELKKSPSPTLHFLKVEQKLTNVLSNLFCLSGTKLEFINQPQAQLSAAM